jgi:hypothetical protein
VQSVCAQTAPHDRRATASRRPFLCRSHFLSLASFFFKPQHPPFGHFWSTLSDWFQHMPALPRLLFKTSNIHNFRSVVPKIMKFALNAKLSSRHIWTKKSKNSVSLPKTSLAPVGPICPLGVKIQN